MFLSKRVCTPVLQLTWALLPSRRPLSQGPCTYCQGFCTLSLSPLSLSFFSFSCLVKRGLPVRKEKMDVARLQKGLFAANEFRRVPVMNSISFNLLSLCMSYCSLLFAFGLIVLHFGSYYITLSRLHTHPPTHPHTQNHTSTPFFF